MRRWPERRRPCKLQSRDANRSAGGSVQAGSVQPVRLQRLRSCRQRGDMAYLENFAREWEFSPPKRNPDDMSFDDLDDDVEEDDLDEEEEEEDEDVEDLDDLDGEEDD